MCKYPAFLVAMQLLAKLNVKLKKKSKNNNWQEQVVDTLSLFAHREFNSYLLLLTEKMNPSLRLQHHSFACVTLTYLEILLKLRNVQFWSRRQWPQSKHPSLRVCASFSPCVSVSMCQCLDFTHPGCLHLFLLVSVSLFSPKSGSEKVKNIKKQFLSMLTILRLQQMIKRMCLCYTEIHKNHCESC